MGTQRHIDTIWGSTAAGPDIADPGTLKMNLGWLEEIPQHEYENFWHNRVDEALEYSQESGVEAWLSLVIYRDEGLTMGTDGIVYQSQQSANLGHNPVGDDGTWWRPQIAVSDIGGSVYGLEIAQAADADHDLTVSPGGCPAKNVFLATAITKRVDAAFSAGNGSGGLKDGIADTVAANTSYHIHLIRLDATKVLDVYYDVDPGGANIPAGYSHMCRITSMDTDSSANWNDFTNSGDEFLKASFVTATINNPGTSAVTPTLSIPTGVKLLAHLSINMRESAAAERRLLVSSMDQPDLAPSAARFTLYVDPESGGSGSAEFTGRILTDTSGRIRYRAETSGATFEVYRTTYGWTDHRRGLS